MKHISQFIKESVFAPTSYNGSDKFMRTMRSLGFEFYGDKASLGVLDSDTTGKQNGFKLVQNFNKGGYGCTLQASKEPTQQYICNDVQMTTTQKQFFTFSTLLDNKFAWNISLNDDFATNTNLGTLKAHVLDNILKVATDFNSPQKEATL